MDFFGIGILEIIIVLIIALIVVGPQRLPQMALKMGQMMRRLRMVTTELVRDINEEVHQETDSLKSDVLKDSQEIASDIENMTREDEESKR